MNAVLHSEVAQSKEIEKGATATVPPHVLIQLEQVLVESCFELDLRAEHAVAQPSVRGHGVAFRGRPVQLV